MGYEKVCDRYCRGCVYFQGNSETSCMCCYILIEGRMRGCDPGKGCTVKIKRKKKRRTGED